MLNNFFTFSTVCVGVCHVLYMNYFQISNRIWFSKEFHNFFSFSICFCPFHIMYYGCFFFFRCVLLWFGLNFWKNYAVVVVIDVFQNQKLRQQQFQIDFRCFVSNCPRFEKKNSQKSWKLTNENYKFYNQGLRNFFFYKQKPTFVA